MIDIKLNTLQAFNAMHELLEIYFKRTSSDSIVTLLSGMQFLIDGCTADQAIWEEWKDLVKESDLMTSKQAFDFAYKYMQYFFRGSSSTNVRSLLNDMQCSEDGTIINPETALLWDQCVVKVLAQPQGTKNYLMLLDPDWENLDFNA